MSRSNTRKAPRGSIWNAVEGGVANFSNVQAAYAPFGDKANAKINHATIEIQELWESKRWVTSANPIGAGNKFFHVHNFYAIASARRDPFLTKTNERLLGLMFAAAGAMHDAPTVICMDLNADPAQSEIVQKATLSGQWVDLALITAPTKSDGSKIAPLTFRHDGPYAGMTRDHKATRIDCILANRCAMAVFDKFEHHYDLGIPQHVGLQAYFRVPKLGAKATFVTAPKTIQCNPDLSEQAREIIWDKCLGRDALQKVRYMTNSNQVEKAFETLCDLGTDFLLAAADADENEGEDGVTTVKVNFDVGDIPPCKLRKYERGRPPTFSVKDVAPDSSARFPVNFGKPNQTNKIANLARSAKQLAQRVEKLNIATKIAEEAANSGQNLPGEFYQEIEHKGKKLKILNEWGLGINREVSIQNAHTTVDSYPQCPQKWGNQSDEQPPRWTKISGGRTAKRTRKSPFPLALNKPLSC